MTIETRVRSLEVWRAEFQEKAKHLEDGMVKLEQYQNDMINIFQEHKDCVKEITESHVKEMHDIIKKRPCSAHEERITLNEEKVNVSLEKIDKLEPIIYKWLGGILLLGFIVMAVLAYFQAKGIKP